jgi:elongation factor G
MKTYTYKGMDDNKLIEGEIPSELLEEAKKKRGELIEAIAEYDDDVLEKYIEGKELTETDIKKAIRVGVVSGKFFPILGGDTRTAIVQTLLNAIVEYLPSPKDVPPVEGINPKTAQVEKRLPDNKEPFSALAFKVVTDPHVGRLVYVRVYSGTVKTGDSVYNTTRQKSDRIGKLVLMHGDKRELIPEAYAGEIVAIVGVKETTTGNTLCAASNPIILESIEFPEPVISLAIEPETKADQEKMGLALKKLSDEDPTFKIKADHETGQTIISGMGELQLEILVDRMKREFNVHAQTGAPQVAYKETIKATARGEGKYIKQTGGRGQYGHCFLEVKPLGRGEGLIFVNKIKGGSIPAEFISSVEKGVKGKVEKGVLAGYPMTDLKVTLYDGSFHDVDSSDIAFQIAGSMALESAVKKATLILLEPVMKVEVATPDEFMGDIIGDLSAKRAQIQGSEKKGALTYIYALAPLAELTGYVTRVRSISQGRANPYVEPSHYEEVPGNIAENLVTQKMGSKEKRK